MFGTFRFILAIMVVLTHIGGIEIISGIAVWSFFMLSGFLMTTVLNEKYGLDSNGIKVFAESRFYRLFPLYWVSIILAAVFISIFDDYLPAKGINVQLILPSNLHDYVSSIFIFGTTVFGLGRPDSALSPSVWAVDVELLMYAVSCIYLSRVSKNCSRLLLVLLLSFPILWYAAKLLISEGMVEIGNQVIYSFIWAALLPYTLGAFIYFNRELLNEYILRINIYVILALATLSMLASVFLVSKISVTIAYLFPMPFMFMTIVALGSIKGSETKSAKLDNYLGMMSYPIYLLHWIVGYIALLTAKNFGFLSSLAAIDSTGLYRFNTIGFLYVFVLVLLFSAAAVHLVEYPVDKFRIKLKKSKLSRKMMEAT